MPLSGCLELSNDGHGLSNQPGNVHEAWPPWICSEAAGAAGSAFRAASEAHEPLFRCYGKPPFSQIAINLIGWLDHIRAAATASQAQLRGRSHREVVRRSIHRSGTAHSRLVSLTVLARRQKLRPCSTLGCQQPLGHLSAQDILFHPGRQKQWVQSHVAGGALLAIRLHWRDAGLDICRIYREAGQKT